MARGDVSPLWKRILEGPWIPAAIALAAAAFLIAPGPTATEASSHQSGPPPAPPATPEVTAWLGGLKVGEELAGWEVTRVSAPRDRQVEIEVEREDTGFVVSVARPGAVPHRAPIETERHALFYGKARPPGTELGEEWRPVLEALAERLEDVSSGAAVPEGL